MSADMREALELAKQMVASHYPRHREYKVAAALIASQAAPIDMILHCPKCGLQHIDGVEAPGPNFYRHADEDRPWDNPPHRSHLCHGCGHIWRPADVATNGVAAIKTKGQADSPAVTSQAAKGETVAWVNVDKHGDHKYHGIQELPVGRHHLYTAPPSLPDVISLIRSGELRRSKSRLIGWTFTRDPSGYPESFWGKTPADAIAAMLAASPEVPRG